jgi:cbb3-type cytochrome oxidase subunit 3
MVSATLSTLTLTSPATKTQKLDPNHIPCIQCADAYPKQIWWFFACVIIIMMFFHAGSFLVLWRQKRCNTDPAPHAMDNEKASAEDELSRHSVHCNSLTHRFVYTVATTFHIFAYQITLLLESTIAPYSMTYSATRLIGQWAVWRVISILRY